MPNKFKPLLGILIFAAFIGVASFAYGRLREKSAPLDVLPSESPGSQNQSGAKRTAAPDFTVLDADGKEVRLSDLFGKPIVLNFWASWCPPCRGEMPDFDKVYGEVKDDITFVMVDMTDGQRETQATGAKFAADQGFAFPVYFDTKGEAAGAYGVTSIPSTVFIDRDGFIVAGAEGALDEKTLRKGVGMISGGE